jgi:hypothetical protein
MTTVPIHPERVEWDSRIEYRIGGHGGILHRVDGPAIKWHRAGEEWYYYGKLHRIGGPAVVIGTISELWYYHGLQHRDDGPAVTEHLYDGGFFFQRWYLDGVLYDTVSGYVAALWQSGYIVRSRSWLLCYRRS